MSPKRYERHENSVPAASSQLLASSSTDGFEPITIRKLRAVRLFSVRVSPPTHARIQRFSRVSMRGEMSAISSGNYWGRAKMQGRRHMPSGCYDFRPFGLADHPDAEFLGFFELRASTRPRDDQIGPGADGARGARPQSLGLGLCLVAAHRFQASCENDGLAGPFGLARGRDEGGGPSQLE